MAKEILTKSKRRAPAAAVRTVAASRLPLSIQERLAILKKVSGIWKNRKPDPIEELQNIRKGWDRKIG